MYLLELLVFHTQYHFKLLVAVHYQFHVVFDFNVLINIFIYPFIKPFYLLIKVAILIICYFSIIILPYLQIKLTCQKIDHKLHQPFNSVFFLFEVSKFIINQLFFEILMFQLVSQDLIDLLFKYAYQLSQVMNTNLISDFLTLK